MGQLVRGAPGLYLKGLPSEPVLPLSAIAGFVGIAERGPLHRPEPLRTWDEYLTVFGDFVDYGLLPHAVFGFFRNGGVHCFIVRAADLTDYAGENPPNRCPRVDLLRAAANDVPVNDAYNQETIRIAAINEGRWGNRLRFEVLPASQRAMPLTTLALPAAAGATTLTVEEPFDLDANATVRLAPLTDPFGGRLATVMTVDGATGVATLAAPLDGDLARGTLVLGQGFKLVVRLDDRREVFDNLSMSPTNARYFVRVVNGPDDALPYIERQARGHSILVEVSHVLDALTQRSRFKPVPPQAGQNTLSGGGDGFRYSAATLRDTANQSSIRVVARAAAANADALGSKGNTMRVRARAFEAKAALAAAAGADRVVLDNVVGLRVGDNLTLAGAETHPILSVGPANVVVLDIGGAGLAAAVPLDALVTVAGRFTLSVFRGTAVEPLEVHRNLSADPADPRYFRPLLEPASTMLCGDGPDVLLQPPANEVALADGRDPGSIDFRWYTGYEINNQYFVPPGAAPARRYGLACLETVDEIDLVAVPDLAGQTLLPPSNVPTGQDELYLLAHRQVLYHAARLGDRIALLDTRAGVAPPAAARLPQKLADPLTAKFGALYYPWLTVAVGRQPRLAPPSGFVAGVMARADREGGAGRAPANFPLKDVVDLEVFIDQGDQDDLNPAGVNAARKFEAPALELWGARTLSADPAARYVNVRRLLIAVKKAIGRTLLWTVFEPNGPALRQRIQASLESLMRTLVAGGATPSADAFFVRCDDGNNPPEVTEAGQVVATVGVALVAPTEFIVLNVKRTPDAVSVGEEAG